MNYLNKQQCIKDHTNHFNSEKKNGIKKAYYTWHYELDGINCMDTDQQFKQYLTSPHGAISTMGGSWSFYY